MAEVAQPQLTPVRPSSGLRLSLRRFVRSQAPSPDDRSKETRVDHDHHYPTTQSPPVLQLQLKPNTIDPEDSTSHAMEDSLHHGDQHRDLETTQGSDGTESEPDDSDEDDEEDEVPVQGTLTSETPSEKHTNEVTRTNTQKNQFSFRAVGAAVGALQPKKTKEKKDNTKEENTSLPAPNERQLGYLLIHFSNHGLMFPYPGQGSHRKEGIAKAWRFWESKAVANSSDGIMADYRASLTHARDYKSCKSHGWKSLKENMELISQLLANGPPTQAAVTHVLKRGVYPTDVDVFQNSLTLYLPVRRNRISILTDAIAKVIGNEDDYVFYDKEFDISRFRKYIIGITFLKTVDHVTIKVWIQPVITTKYKQTYFHEHNTRMIQNLCQLLYDASGGELGEDIAGCMFCDNRLVMDTPYVFPQLYRGRAKL